MKGKSSPVFSVVIPVFNAEFTVVGTLNSVSKQSFADFEVIIIDDGSQDNSNILIKELIHNRPNFHYYWQKNAGVAAARNKALSLAKGEYVAFLDADDLWDESKLEMYFQCIQNNLEKTVFYSDCQIINSDGNKLIRQDAPSALNYKLLLWRNYIPLSTAVVKRNAAFNIRFQRVGHEDYRYWLDILNEQNENMPAIKVSSNNPLTLYRLSKNSISGKKGKAIKWHWLILKEQDINTMARIVYFLNYASYNAYKLIKLKLFALEILLEKKFDCLSKGL
jgi:glycosyltransferase involved in cell wall biosynthesis